MKQTLQQIEQCCQAGGKGPALFFVYKTKESNFDESDNILKYKDQRHEDVYAICNKSLPKLEKQMLEWLDKFSQNAIKYTQSFTFIEPLLVQDSKLSNSLIASTLAAQTDRILNEAKSCQVFHFMSDEPINCKTKISLDGQIYFSCEKIPMSTGTKDRVLKNIIEFVSFASTQLIFVEYIFSNYTIQFLHPVVRDLNNVNVDIAELNQVPIFDQIQALLQQPANVVARTPLSLGGEPDSLSKLLYQTFVERTRALASICCVGAETDDGLVNNFIQCCKIFNCPYVKQKNTRSELAFQMIALRTSMLELISPKLETDDKQVQTGSDDLNLSVDMVLNSMNEKISPRQNQQKLNLTKENLTKQNQSKQNLIKSPKLQKLQQELFDLQTFYQKVQNKNSPVMNDIARMEQENNELEAKNEKLLWDILQTQQQKIDVGEKIRDLEMKFEIFFYKNSDIQNKIAKVRKQLLK